MKRKFYFLILPAIAVFFLARVQKQNNVWALRQQAGIDFTDSTPALLHTSITNNGSCVPASGHHSALPFYIHEATVGNGNHIPMPNDTGMQSGGLFRDLVTVPFINDTTRFYSFRPTKQSPDTAGALYASVADMSLTYLNAIIRSFVR